MNVQPINGMVQTVVSLSVYSLLLMRTTLSFVSLGRFGVGGGGVAEQAYPSQKTSVTVRTGNAGMHQTEATWLLAICMLLNGPSLCEGCYHTG